MFGMLFTLGDVGMFCFFALLLGFAIGLRAGLWISKPSAPYRGGPGPR